MGFALVAKCDPAGFAGVAAATRYGTLSGGPNVTATEAEAQNKARVAGTFSNLTAYMDNVGTGRVVRFRKNTANGNQVVNGTDITAGVYTDAVNTDAVVATDLFNASITEGVGATTYYWVNALFSATSGHAVYYVAADETGITYNTNTNVYSFMSGPLVSSTLGNTRYTARVDGTIQNLQCYVSANAASITVNFKSHVNAGGGACNVVVGAGLTGFFEDAVHTQAFNSGDTINYDIGSTGSNNVTVKFIGCAVVSSSSPINDVFNGAAGASITRAASGTANYYPFLGTMQAAITTEDNKTAIRHQFPCQTSKMRIYVSANTYAASGTMQLRNNLNTNGAQVLTITNGVTGLFEDTTHTDTLVAGDDIAFSIVGGTSGSITLRWAGLLEQDTTPAAGGKMNFFVFDSPEAVLRTVMVPYQ